MFLLSTSDKLGSESQGRRWVKKRLSRWPCHCPGSEIVTLQEGAVRAEMPDYHPEGWSLSKAATLYLGSIESHSVFFPWKVGEDRIVSVWGWVSYLQLLGPPWHLLLPCGETFGDWELDDFS